MTFVLIIHMLIAVVLVTLVLMQQSEGGALGMGGGGSGGGFMTGRGTANLLTRLTVIFGGLFFATSILLTYLESGRAPQQTPLDNATQSSPTKPATANKPAPAKPTGSVLEKLKKGDTRLAPPASPAK